MMRNAPIRRLLARSILDLRMPTYEYQCDACGHRFERFQSITAQPIRKCPHCGKSKVRRLIGTGAGLIFKGSGFYATDYRSEKYKESAKKESAAASPSSGETKSAPHTENKPAATKERNPAKTDAKT
jgi:putative FmdB family regulatory protein